MCVPCVSTGLRTELCTRWVSTSPPAESSSPRRRLQELLLSSIPFSSDPLKGVDCGAGIGTAPDRSQLPTATISGPPALLIPSPPDFRIRFSRHFRLLLPPAHQGCSRGSPRFR